MLPALLISVVLPFALFGISIGKKRTPAFLLGVLTYIVGLLAIRWQLVDLLLGRVRILEVFEVQHPAAFSLAWGAAGAAAGEILRFLIMLLFLKRKDRQSAVLFGAGQGGAEALLLVGVPAIGAMASSVVPFHPHAFAVTSVEQLFIGMMQIGLSILVLQSITRRDWRYLAMAAISHAAILTAVNVIPYLLHPGSQMRAIQTVFAAGGLLLAGYAVLAGKRREAGA